VDEIAKTAGLGEDVNESAKKNPHTTSRKWGWMPSRQNEMPGPSTNALLLAAFK
jgi:hypothetical protein